MKFIKLLVLIVALLGSMAASAQSVLGKDYTRLSQAQPMRPGNKVEVLEFFFYGCSHCYHLHPFLNAWEKKIPKDVELQYVPVIFRDNWEPMARTFYALDALGQRDKLHDDLFKAWNVSNIDLSGEAQAANFVVQRGVDRNKFAEAYNSFAVSSKVIRCSQMQESYQIRGTPTIVVDGKYTITGLQPADMIRVLNDVIDLARKERAGKH
jgi:thiol:disulfide interchange protein DsbA